MKVKYEFVLFSCFLCAILIYSCRKESFNGVEDKYLQEKQLLKEKGGSLKDGVLSFTSPTNTKHILTLDWSSAKKYNFKGVDYTEVFFSFNHSDPNNDNLSQTQKSDSSNSTEIKFSVVFRRINDTLQAVIKYTLPKTTIVNGDSLKVGKSENFYSFQGEWINSWFTDFASGRVMKRSNLPSSTIEIASASASKAQQRKSTNYDDPSCYTYVENYYSYECRGTVIDASTNFYDNICGYWYVGSGVFSYCYNNIFAGGGSSWPPGSVGGGGSNTSGGSSQPTNPPKTPCPTSKEALKLTFPGASDAALDSLASLINEYGGKFGLDNAVKLQHFIAQAAHETGGFQKLTKKEDFYYTTSARLMKVFHKKFSYTDPRKRNPDNYLRKPQETANFVYANRGGNGNEASGDGFRFRGRGIFQLTHKSNYQEFQNYYNANFSNPIDLVNNPDLLVSSDKLSVLSAMWYYKSRVLSATSISENTSVEIVTKLINNGENGLSERKLFTKRAKMNIFCL